MIISKKKLNKTIENIKKSLYVTVWIEYKKFLKKNNEKIITDDFFDWLEQQIIGKNYENYE